MRFDLVLHCVAVLDKGRSEIQCAISFSALSQQPNGAVSCNRLFNFQLDYSNNIRMIISHFLGMFLDRGLNYEEKGQCIAKGRKIMKSRT